MATFPYFCKLLTDKGKFFNMHKRQVLICTLLLTTAIAYAQTPQPRYELRNGYFFNGQDFDQKTWYVSGGMLTTKKPAVVDSVIDLENHWVIPAMGDLFSISVADNTLAMDQLNTYQSEGVQYLLIAGNTPEGREQVSQMAAANKKLPDMVFTNGTLTARGGYPVLDQEARAAKVYQQEDLQKRRDELLGARTMLGKGYWLFDTPADISSSWKKLQDQKPGALLVQLRQSGTAGSRGLSPAMAKAVAKQAKKSKLRVFYQIETLDDLRLALSLKPGGIIGLPGASWMGKGSSEAFQLSDADIAALAKRQVPVVPQFAQIQGVEGVEMASIKAFQAQTLKRLMDKGVQVCMGSGDPQRTFRNELNYWFQLGGLDSGKMLKVLCEHTPRAIYPDRKVGRIADGFEANLIVLTDNPLSNILKVRASSFKMKNGRL
jgi:hypothetical protein